jgi:hypothetical protein
MSNKLNSRRVIKLIKEVRYPVKAVEALRVVRG